MKTLLTEKDKKTVRWILIIGGIVVLTLIVTRFIRPIRVSGESMEPTLSDGDWLIGLPSIEYEYGEIVVVKATKPLIKRIVGLPGDRIEIKDGFLYRNGNKIEEPYVQGKTESKDDVFLFLGENEVYVLGDNREHSMDSREYGPFDKSQVVFHIPG